MTSRTGAIVLAGGRSSRFGRDKLAEPLDGRPLLDHAIEVVRAIADEVVVMVAADGESRVPAGVTVVHDARPFEGPLAALDTGLAAVTAHRVIVVGGDMPSLVPAVLDRLLTVLGDDAPAVILEVEGPRAILPLALAREPARAAVRQLLDRGERRLGAVLDVLGVRVVAAAEWRPDDPLGRTLRDVDTPADL